MYDSLFNPIRILAQPHPLVVATMVTHPINSMDNHLPATIPLDHHHHMEATIPLDHHHHNMEATIKDMLSHLQVHLQVVGIPLHMGGIPLHMEEPLLLLQAHPMVWIQHYGAGFRCVCTCSSVVCLHSLEFLLKSMSH